MEGSLHNLSVPIKLVGNYCAGIDRPTYTWMWRKTETNLTNPFKISDTDRDETKEIRFGSVQTFTQFFLPCPFVLPLQGLQLHPAAWPVVPFLGKAPGKWSCQKVTANIQPRDVSSDIWNSMYSKNAFSLKSSLHLSRKSQKVFFEVGCPIVLWIWPSNCGFEQTVGTFKRPHSFYWRFFICVAVVCMHTPAHRHCMVLPDCLEH